MEWLIASGVIILGTIAFNMPTWLWIRRTKKELK